MSSNGPVKYTGCGHTFSEDRLVDMKESWDVCPRCRSGLKPTKPSWLNTFHICIHLELKWMQGYNVKDFNRCQTYVCHLNACPWNKVCIEKIDKRVDDVGSCLQNQEVE